MRVLHITTEYPPVIYGGLGTAVGGLVAASASAGLQVAVLLVGGGATPAYRALSPERADGGHARREQDGEVVLFTVPHSSAVAASSEFARQWRPDVIHVHVFWLAHVAAAVREATGAPLVYTVHSLDRAEYELGQGPADCLSQWPIQSDLIHSADIIVALTREERELVAEYCPEARHRVRVVGNGIADIAQPRKRRKPRGAIDILYTGRFVDRKGIRELLSAAPAILEAAPGARLVMAGGYRHATVDELVNYWLPPECAPFRDRIVFTGWLTPAELAVWYANADILVVPSWYEPFGMVILEGMLYGLSIVAAAVGGPKEILVGEETGLFCEPKDGASLAAQVIRLIRDPELRSRISRKAAAAVRSHWLHAQVLDKMKAVYREAIFAAA